MDTPFSIFEITEELAARIAGTPGEPHRHDYEEIIILTKGNPCHFIDFKREQLAAPMAVYVAMGKIHQINLDPDTRGWAIRYTNEFMPSTGFHFYSHFLDNISTLLSSEMLSDIETLCRMMLKEFKKEPPGYPVIRHLLGALVTTLEEEGRKHYPDENDAANPDLITLNNFLRILDDNFRRSEGVEFYAQKMNMTPRSLNNISKSVMGMSISEIIEARKLTEARNLLLNSGKTISEIGFEVGYNEKSYFTRVFHKKTGFTPTAFREKMKDLIS